MNRWHAILVLAVLLSALPAADAQMAPRSPRIGYIYPAGGRQGTAFQVTVGGQFLDGTAGVDVSGAGVQATVVEHIKPITPQQANKLKDELKELLDKRRDAKSRTEADEKRIAEIRKKLALVVRKPPNPAISEKVVLQVTLTPDAELGRRELRLGTLLGLTNPLAFHVGQLPEFSEQSARPIAPAKLGKKARGNVGPVSGQPETETNIPLPAVVNGQITPGDVDRFRFTARKGQRLVVAASARDLIPYLPDAVPGWFQATLALYDAQGRELAYDDDYRFHPDPVLFYQIPADGSYVIEIKDAVYRGREDFVYRIAVGELPFVTGVFPLGGRTGQKTPVALTGWNLPATRATLDATDKRPGTEMLSLGREDGLAGRVPFALDMLPECFEKEPNDEPGRAQAVAMPVIVNGRIDRPEDWDVFRIEGRAGTPIVAEVCARRLGSPLDSVLKLTDATGRQLAINDDHEDKGAGLVTHHADSWLSATFPADGIYYLHLGDAQHKGGADYAYRLRISAPRPDFELRVVPSSINARAGMTVPVTVYALRKDGFSGEIAVAMKDPPRGFTLSGGRVPAGQDQVRCTLTAPSTATKDPVRLDLEGRAVIDGRDVSRPAVPAEDMMQAFAYRHLVPSQELKAVVAGRSRSPGVKIFGDMPIKIPAGGTARVRIEAPLPARAGQVELELNDPPEGISLQGFSPSADGFEIRLAGESAKLKPGLKGNLIVNVLAKRAAPAGKAKPQAKQRSVPLTSLPAIPFEIVKP